MATPYRATRTVTRSSVGTPTVRKSTTGASNVADEVKRAKSAYNAAAPSTAADTFVTKTSALDTEPEWLKYAPVIEDNDTSGVSASSYYNKYLKEQQKAIQKKIDASVQANNAYIPEINQASDQSLQNAYILREQNRVNAPQALSAMGYTGGATETSMMGINTGYENTRNQIEQNRAESLAEIQQNEAQIRATGDATLSDAAATYYQNLIAAQKEAEAAAQAQANWQAQYDLSEQQYSDAAAQQAWQNAYDEKLLALKNATTAKSSSGSSGSSSSGTSSSRGTSSSSGSENNATPTQYYTTADRILSGLSVPSSKTALIKQYNSIGKLTDSEATALLRKYGLLG